MIVKNDLQAVRRRSIDLLARREHAYFELIQKLVSKGFDQDLVATTVNQLAKAGLQDNKRYAEMICKVKMAAGYGPVWIRQQLRIQKIESEIIDELIDENAEIWSLLCLDLYNKHYKNEIKTSKANQAKRAQFLYRKGFNLAQVTKTLNGSELQ